MLALFRLHLPTYIFLSLYIYLIFCWIFTCYSTSFNLFDFYYNLIDKISVNNLFYLFIFYLYTWIYSNITAMYHYSNCVMLLCIIIIIFLFNIWTLCYCKFSFFIRWFYRRGWCFRQLWIFWCSRWRFLWCNHK